MGNIYEHKLTIDKVLIENFRLFDKIEFELHKNLTIFISENGAGKTTILDAIAGHLHYLTDFIKKNVIGTSLPQKIKSYFPYHIDDINDLSKSVILNLVLNASYFDMDKNEEMVFSVDNNIQSLFDFNKGDNIGFNANIKGDKDLLTTEVFQQSVGLTYSLFKNISLPILVYYPCNFVKSTSENKQPKPFNQFSAWDDALNGQAFDFSDFANWYKFLINKSNHTRIESILQKTIKNAILDVLNDNNNKNFTNFNLSFENYPEELIIIKKDKSLKFNQLSSGEKHILILVSDIARRLCVANPASDNPLLGQGIVLIDEIDLHLHPKWQRKIVPKLLEIFPNIQFVVTTHSPLVITNSMIGNVYKLSNQNIEKLDHFGGQHISSALYEFYGIPSRIEDIQNKIDKLFEFIDNEEKEKALELYTNLHSILGDDDVAMIEAKSSIEIMYSL